MKKKSEKSDYSGNIVPQVFYTSKRMTCVLGLKVKKKDGEKTRRRLDEEGLLLKNYRIINSQDFLIFPVKDELEGEMVEEEFEELPSKKLTLRQIVFGLRAFDVIGDIAVVEIPEGLSEKRGLIGEVLIASNKNIRCVFEKKSEISGAYRTRLLSHIAGEKGGETMHREYGCRFMLDVEKVFFSPRLATERRRIAGLVKEGEKVLDMFCGVGPFSIVISKHSCAKVVHASDINRHAIEYLERNIEINRAKNVIPYREDARRIFDVVGDVDRCIMNLPKKGGEFLDLAARHARFIHFYCISENLERTKEEIEGRGMRVDFSRKVKEYSPKKSIYCLDLETFSQSQSDDAAG